MSDFSEKGQKRTKDVKKDKKGQNIKKKLGENVQNLKYSETGQVIVCDYRMQ